MGVGWRWVAATYGTGAKPLGGLPSRQGGARRYLATFAYIMACGSRLWGAERCSKPGAEPLAHWCPDPAPQEEFEDEEGGEFEAEKEYAVLVVSGCIRRLHVL